MRLTSGLINRLIKLFWDKSFFEDDNKFNAYLEKKRESNKKTYYLRYRFPKEIIVETQKIQGMRYFVFNRVNCNKKTIFYYHGGSYIDKPNYFHFKFLERLLLEKEVCVVMPIYPRLPDNTAIECYKMLNILFDDFISKNQVDNIVFMGDSAGGGLALGMAQQVKDRYEFYKKNKQKIVLLSPWLNMAVDNPQVDIIQPYDYQLSKVGLAKMGAMWSNGDNKSSFVSPLYGDLDCGKIDVFVGTRDILFPDSHELQEKLKDKGLQHGFYKFDNMSHCFMLFPTQEADNAFRQIMECV